MEYTQDHNLKHQYEENYKVHPTELDPKNADKNVKEQRFYDNSSTESEAERLDMMAKAIADDVSLRAILPTLEVYSQENSQPVVFDVGAGDSPALGQKLERAGARYVCTDMRPDAVERQRTAGNTEAYVATSDKLPDIQADVFNARAVFGWLSPQSIERTYAGMARLGKEKFSIVVQDYDWGASEGPEAFKNAINIAIEKLSDQGFDVNYGSRIKDDMTRCMSQILDSSEQDIAEDLTEIRQNVFEGSITEASPFIIKTADAIATMLDSVGMNDDAKDIRESLDELTRYITQHPDEIVKLPDIVAVRLDIDNNTKCLPIQTLDGTPSGRPHISTVHNVESDKVEEGYVEAVDYERFKYHNGQEIPLPENIAVTKSGSRLEYDVRSMQAKAYLDDGIVGEDAIVDGVLSPEIDPPELVARSVYAVRMGKNYPLGCVRAIKEDFRLGPHGRIYSLPTIARLRDHSPHAFEWLQNHDLMRPGRKVVEVSALAKNSSEGTLEDPVMAVIGLAAYFREKGYDYAVMGLNKKHYRVIKGIFGCGAVEDVEGDDAVHPIALPGVKNTVSFIPMIVGVQEFIERVNAHAYDQLERDYKEDSIFKHIADVTDLLITKNEKTVA